MVKRKIKLKGKPLEATIAYDEPTAIKLTNTAYYEAMAEDTTSLHFRDQEKNRLYTQKKPEITGLIEHYLQHVRHQHDGAFFILEGIYKRNRKAAANGEIAKTTNILNIVASLPMLSVSYKAIRGNKGASTLAAQMAQEEYSNLDQEQKDFIDKTAKCPDGISMDVFRATSALLRTGRYPWGTSRRIYVPKPGRPDAMRPITIPPFMDRVVQHSIKMVLEAIYEPYFEKLNRSFGFRSHVGTHDSIYALQRAYNSGSYTAIEGDIKAAFDKLNKQKLINILKKRIKDNKFIKLMQKRLDYVFFDTKSEEFIREKDGVPQGGIDSPYLWNIYTHEFDVHITEYLDNMFKKLNLQVRGPISDTSDKFTRQVTKLKTTQTRIKQEIKSLNRIRKALQANPSAALKLKGTTITSETLMHELYSRIKANRLMAHQRRKLAYSDFNKDVLKYTFTRYADDWIIVGTFSDMLAQKIKAHIKDWLQSNLDLTLSEEKTAITDMRKQAAHFLGFELRAKTTRKLKRVWQPVTIRIKGEIEKRKKRFLKKTAGQEIYVAPDKARLINKMYMKGYCDKQGNPKEVPWLSALEGFIIIERFNAVIRGLANYYLEFISRPRALERWIYILRYSCLKTLAQKYRLSIRKLFKKFRVPGRSNNVQSTVTQYYDYQIFTKAWRLLTSKEAIANARRINRFSTIESRFNTIEYPKKFDQPVMYFTRQGKVPTVMSFNFLDAIHWTSLRQKFSLNLPCFLCGSPDEVEMHHIKHVRKRKYSHIPQEKYWLQMMSLRNRKQIPVCRSCHMNIIHSGNYSGFNLKSLAPYESQTDGGYTYVSPTVGYDNRTVNPENYINKRALSENPASVTHEAGYKTNRMTLKGWKKR